MSKLKVVLTGAAGYVAGRMLPAFRERYNLVLLDVKDTDRAGNKIDGIHIADLTDRDRDTYRQYFEGAHAVIHCGFTWSRRADERYWAEIDNVNMTYNVYQTALEEGARRVVVASSNHAADYYEHLIWSDRCDFVTPDMRPLSDNYYGWGKIAYESLGFVFASGGGGKDRLEVVQIRIGGPRENDVDGCSVEDLSRMHRALGAYLSVRDQVQLFVKSIEAPSIEDENGVPFQIFYGVSDNTHNFWSIQNAREVIDYQPEDNSQVKFADKIAQILGQAHQRQYGAEEE